VSVTLGASTSSRATSQASGGLVFIAPSDGAAIAIYHDGSDIVFRVAASPYSSWSSATVIEAGAFAHPAACLGAADAIHVIYADGSRNLKHAALSRSGASWSVGSEHAIATGDYGGNDKTHSVAIDSGGNLWALSGHWTGSAYATPCFYSTDSGANWSVSQSDLLGSTLADDTPLKLAVTGTRLLALKHGSGNTHWRRRETSDGLTSWVAEQNVSSGIWYNHYFDAQTDDSGRIVIAGAPQPGGTDYAIRTKVYTPGSDTWGSNSDIGTGTSDRFAALMKAGADLYCFWAEFAASNSYAVVYKKWTDGSGTWGSKSTLESAGVNRTYLAAGGDQYDALAMWTEGTGSPWDVKSSALSLGTRPGGGSPKPWFAYAQQ
jgi:hypothetical protein